MEKRTANLTPNQIDSLRQESARICAFSDDALRSHHLDLLSAFISQYLRLSGIDEHNAQLAALCDLVQNGLKTYYDCPDFTTRCDRVIYLQRTIYIQFNLLKGKSL